MMTLKKKTKKQIKRYMEDVMAQTLNPGFAFDVASSVFSGFQDGVMDKYDRMQMEAAQIMMDIFTELKKKAHYPVTDEFKENGIRGTGTIVNLIYNGGYEPMDRLARYMTIFGIICQCNGIDDEEQTRLLKACRK